MLDCVGVTTTLVLKAPVLQYTLEVPVVVSVLLTPPQIAAGVAVMVGVGYEMDVTVAMLETETIVVVPERQVVCRR